MPELILTAAWLDKTFYGFDNGILKALHSLGEATGYLANYFFRFITSFAEGGYFMLAMCLAMILIPCIPAIYRKNPDKARNVIICGLAGFTAIALGAVITNLTIKRQVARIRPYEATQLYHDWWILAKGNIDKEFSFPSGHSTNGVIAYGSMPAYKKNKGLLAVGILMPLLIGLSRVMLGVHYPTDVLVGWACGGAVVLFVSYLQRKIERKGLLRLVIFTVSLTGIFFCRTSDYYTALGVMGGMFLALPFEKKYVNFEMTSDPAVASLRVLGGLILYFALNTLMKMPFDAEWLAQPELPQFLVRAVRYFIIGFVLLGIYPMLFRMENRIRESLRLFRQVS